MAFCNLTYTSPWPLNDIQTLLFETLELQTRQLPVSDILALRQQQVLDFVNNANQEIDPDVLAELSSMLMRWGVESGPDRKLRARMVEKSAGLAAVAASQAPSDYLTWLNLARTQMALGYWDEAEICLKRSRGLVLHRQQVRMFRPPDSD